MSKISVCIQCGTKEKDALAFLFLSEFLCTACRQKKWEAYLAVETEQQISRMWNIVRLRSVIIPDLTGIIVGDMKSAVSAKRQILSSAEIEVAGHGYAQLIIYIGGDGQIYSIVDEFGDPLSYVTTFRGEVSPDEARSWISRD